eukprot:SAG31_NODE_9642_length_1247_cov_0.863240_1_plen_56_part_01
MAGSVGPIYPVGLLPGEPPRGPAPTRTRVYAVLDSTIINLNLVRVTILLRTLINLV